jgi:2'-5' RNA ligase
MGRIFIGINVLPEAKLKRFVGLLRRRLWREEIRWVSENNYHLTLKFIGNATSKEKSLLIECISKWIYAQKSLNIDIKGIGLFGPYAKPKILWVGTDSNDELNDIWQKIEQSVVSVGFKKEERSFNPHITIGRIKGMHNADRLRNVIKEHENEFFHTQEVNEVILYRSISQKSGVYYDPIKKFKLGNS